MTAKRRRFIFDLPRELHHRLKVEASSLEMSMGEFVIQAIQLKMEQLEKKEVKKGK